jgi:hypothetical protein
MPQFATTGKRVKRSDNGGPGRTLYERPAQFHGQAWSVASAQVAILVVGEEGSLHPAVAAGALFFSSPARTGEVGAKRRYKVVRRSSFFAQGWRATVDEDGQYCFAVAL